MRASLGSTLQSQNSVEDVELVSLVNPEAMATSGKTDKSPHDQEIKFFAKVQKSINTFFCNSSKQILLVLLIPAFLSPPGVTASDRSDL